MKSVTKQSKAQYAKRASAAPASLGWGWVCNEVCNGYVTRSVTRQSKAQYAKRATQLNACVTRSVTKQSKAQYAKRPSAAPAGPGWGCVCNEVCNSPANKEKQSAVRKARLRSSSSLQLFNASQAAGWGWVCNKVCNGNATRSVTKQSKAQYAKRASAAPT